MDMLVLGRKPGEVIQINQDIILRVLSIGSNHVKLGVLAPNEVKVLRGELVERIERIAATSP